MLDLLDDALHLLEVVVVVGATEATGLGERLAELELLQPLHLEEGGLSELLERRHHVHERCCRSHGFRELASELVAERQQVVRDVEAVVVKDRTELRNPGDANQSQSQETGGGDGIGL